MDTGQLSMMPVNAGVPVLSGVQSSSSAAALPDSGAQAGGLFVGLLAAMTPQDTPPGAAVPVSGDQDASAPEKNTEAASTAVQQDGLSGLMAGLLTSLDAVGKPSATGTEPGAGVRTAAHGSDRKPQDVALNADGLNMALLTQVNSGRMPQVDDTLGQQTAQGTGGPSATEGDAVTPVPAEASDKQPQDVVLNTVGMLVAQSIQANSGRMLQEDGTGAQQAGDTPADAVVTAFSGTSGVSADSSDLGVANALQQAPRGEADTTALPTAPSQLASALAGQKNQTVGSDTVSTERGTAPSSQKGSASGADAPVSPSPAGVEVTAQPPQEATLFRSAPLEVALAESVSQNEARTTGQTHDVSSAQNTPVTEIPAAPAEKATPVQLDARTAKAAPAPGQMTLSPVSPQQPEQAAPTGNRTLEAARSSQAAVLPAAEKQGAEAGGEVVQTQPESTVAAKPVPSVAVEAVKFAGVGSSGGGFGTGDDKGTADNFMNGQFHATLMHQQGNMDGASAVGTVSAPVQSGTPQTGLSEQILQQVNDRLASHDVKTGSDQIVLRLSPENLGDLKVNLTMDGQRLKVEIVAENHLVRDTLLQNTDSLKESLARQNISMDSFNVTTDGRGAGNPGQGQQQNGWREFAQQKQQNAWMSAGGYRLPEVAALPSQLAYQTPSAHTMVDLHF